MFTKPFNFTLKRTGLQAFGFYLFHLLVVVVLGISLGILIRTNAATGLSIGALLALVYSVFITFRVLKRGPNWLNTEASLFLIAAACLGYIGGGFFGLLVPTYLTMRKRKKGNK